MSDPLLQAANHQMFCEWAKEHKQHVVDSGGVGSDLTSCLIAKKGNCTLTCFARLEDLMNALVTVQVIEPESATMIVEVYHVKGQSLFAMHSEALQPRFAAGDPSVVESMAVITVAKGELMLATALNYRYVGKKIEWLEPELRIGRPESNIEHTINMAGSAIVPPDVIQAMESLDDLNRMKFVGYHWAQNFPCEVRLVTDQPPPGFFPEGPSLN